MKHIAYIMLSALLVVAGVAHAENGSRENPFTNMPRPTKPASTTPTAPKEKPQQASSSPSVLPTKVEIKTMVERFDATMDRLQNLINRTESRVVKMKSIGKDTVEAEKAIATAKSKLIEAQTMFQSLKGSIATSTSTTASTTSMTKEGAKKFKKATEQITKNLQSVQVTLLKALAHIEGKGEGKNEKMATSTAPIVSPKADPRGSL